MELAAGTEAVTMKRIFGISLMCIALSCSGAREWRERETFYSKARCDLSINEARALADHLNESGWSCGSPKPQRDVCNFNVGSTRVMLEFADGRLQSVEDGEHYGITGMAMRPKVDVCTGARSRQLGLVPNDAGWVGATVSVDGQPIGSVTTSNWQGLYVPVGRHTLRIEKPGREALVREITMSDGVLRESPEVTLP
jgi:hypothetical protein